MDGIFDGFWRFILGMMRQPVWLRWFLWPLLAVILNIYWFLWVIRWLFGGSVPAAESTGSD
jgi:hypothetical protein